MEDNMYRWQSAKIALFTILLCACLACSCAGPVLWSTYTALMPGQSVVQKVSPGEVYRYSISAKNNDLILLDFEQTETIIYVKLVSPRGKTVNRFVVPAYEKNDLWTGREELRIDADTNGTYQLSVQRFPGLEDSLKISGNFRLQVQQWLSAGEQQNEIAGDDSLIIAVGQNAHAIASVDAGGPYSDLEPLKDILKDVRIVGLGEATHGTSEFFTMKHRMLEFLVKEMRFRLLGIELPYGDCEIIIRYVLSHKGSREKAIERLAWYSTEEVIAMLDWMHDYNKNIPDSSKVRFYGFDMQKPIESLNAVESFLQKIDTAKGQLVHVQRPALYNDDGNLRDTLAKNRAKIFYADLQEYFLQNKLQFIAATSEEKYFSACQNLEVLIQNADLMFRKNFSQSLDRPEESYNEIRDRYMAENVRRIVEHNGPDAQMVLWAHDSHIMQQRVWTNSNSMGMYLQKMFGREYYSFVFIFHHGSFHANLELDSTGYTFGSPKRGSLEWIFGKAGRGSSFLDFRKLVSDPEKAPVFLKERGFRIVGASYSPYWQEPYLGVTPKNFDGIVFIEKTTPSRSPAGFWKRMDPEQEQKRRRNEK